MFSYEIDSLMRSKGYCINKEDYVEIIESTPQLARVNFDAYSNKFHIWTDDGYDWEFDIAND